MEERKEIEVEGIGKVTLSRSERAKYISIKMRPEQIILVVPKRCALQNALRFLEEKKSWIEATREKIEKRAPQNLPTRFDENTRYQTLTFVAQIKRFEGQNFHATLKDGTLTILCPQNAEIGAENVQQLIRKAIERAMMSEAKRVLPARLKLIAEKCGMKYNECRIRSTRTIWGSCTQRSHISLNMFLMRLPQHLVDYVLIHEICHTVELNHSERFWALVNSFTGNKAKELRSELRSYHPCV